MYRTWREHRHRGNTAASTWREGAAAGDIEEFEDSPAADNIYPDNVPAAENINPDDVPAADNINTDDVPGADNINTDDELATDNIKSDDIPADDKANPQSVPAADNLNQDDIDWMSGCSISSLTGLIQSTYPFYSIPRSSTGFRNQAWDFLVADAKRLHIELIPTGSCAENVMGCFSKCESTTRQSLPYDIDCLVVSDIGIVGNSRDSNNLFSVDTRHTHPGYLRLCLNKPHKIRADDKRQIHGCETWYYKNTILPFGYRKDQEHVESTPWHGPAILIENVTTPMQDVFADMDFVSAVKCSSWPKEAKEWITRKRPGRWPSAELIKSILQSGCHVVPVSHPLSSESDIEWRYSFSVGEVALMDSLSDNQCYVYLVLKEMYNKELKQFNVLSSYCLKCLHMWTCEKVPKEAVKKSNIAKFLLLTLDELIFSLAKRSIPNYFIPSNNMIEHISGDSISPLLQKCIHIRKNPSHYIRKLNESLVYSYNLDQRPDEEFIKSICDIKEEAYPANPLFLVSMNVIYALLQASKGTFEIALEWIVAIPEWIIERTASRLLYLDAIAGRLSNEQQIRFYEYLLDDGILGQDIDAAALMSNLGRAFHVKACNPFYTADQVFSFKSAAEKMFCVAKTKSRPWLRVSVDYAFFLLKSERLNDAMNVLQNVEETDEVPAQYNEYNGETKCTLDEVLCKELVITTKQHVKIPSLVLVNYLMIKCSFQAKSRKIPQAVLEHHLSKLVSLCEQTMHDGEGPLQNIAELLDQACGVSAPVYSMAAQSYSLLGHSFMMFGRYTEAADAFSRTAELLPDHITANQNVIFGRNRALDASLDLD